MKNFYVTVGINIQARDDAHAEHLVTPILDDISGALYDHGADASIENVEEG